PLLAVTFTCIVAELTPPPPTRLSRAVTWKFILRVVVGSDSPKVEVLFKISWSLGKVRAGLTVGLKERKIGRLPSSGFGGDCVPRSYSSHANVSASPFASLPLAVRMKGVPIGMLKFGPALIVGATLPVAVSTSQVLPPMKATISSRLLT